MHKHTGRIIMGLVMALAGLAANAAFAADVTPFTMPAGDTTVGTVLAPVFGDLLGGGSGSGGGAAGTLFANFNAALLFVGGILVAYGMLAGTAQTAHDGEVLGRRWSTLWVPIRVSLGLAMVVPVSNGYCTAQMLVSWLGQQGVAIAAGMWSGYAKSGMLPPPADYHPANVPGVRSLALGLLRSDVCALSYAQYMATDTTGDGGYDKGGVTITEVEPGKFSYGTGQVGTDFCGGYTTSPDIILNDPTGVGGAHSAAMTALAARMQTLAGKIVDTTQPLDQKAANAEMNAAVAEYEQAISTAATQAVATANGQLMQTAQTASAGGWLMAGAYYTSQMASVNAVTPGVGATPKAVAPNLSGASPDVAAAVNGMMARADGATSGTNDFFKGPSLWDRAKSAVSGAVDTGKQILSGDIGPGVLMSYISQSFNGFTSAFANVRNANGDAMTNMQHLGSAAMEASIVGFGLSVVLGIISTTGGLILAGISASLFSFGAINGLYLPVLPAILWTAAIIGWIILYVECMIAAPLWAIMHVHMDGDGIAGRGASGYEIILGLLLRPSLITFGYCFALSLATPVVGLFNKIFYAAVAKSFDDPNGILLQIAMFCVYTVTTVSILHRLFALIHIIPDQMSRWWSGGRDSLGADSADHIKRQSHAGVDAAAGGAVGAAMTMSRGAGGSRPKDGKDGDKKDDGDGKGKEDAIVNQRETPPGGGGGMDAKPSTREPANDNAPSKDGGAGSGDEGVDMTARA